MPLPFLATLSLAARTAYPAIQAGVRRGLSGNQILKVLKATNQGIRRQSVFDIIRAEKGIQRAGRALRNVALDRLPNVNRLPKAITRLRRRYSFTVQVIGRMLETGEQILQNITVATDAPRTRRELERLAEDAIERSQDRYGFEIVSSMLVGGKQAGDVGTL